MEASEEWSSTRSWKDGICPLQGCGNRMGGGPLSFAPNPQDDDVQNNPEHDEFNAEQTIDEQPFLLVHGYDMETVPTGALRFWRYEDGDIAEGKTYIVRGLKVVDDKWWCDGVMVTKGDGSKTVEICWRTAVEDITHVQQLARHFHW